jgi:hypothetical protein
MELYLHSPNMPPWRDVQFKKRQWDNFGLQHDFVLAPGAEVSVAFIVT